MAPNNAERRSEVVDPDLHSGQPLIDELLSKGMDIDPDGSRIHVSGVSFELDLLTELGPEEASALLADVEGDLARANSRMRIVRGRGFDTRYFTLGGDHIADRSG